MRQSARGKHVEARINAALARLPVAEPAEGVQPLNAGYFTIERLRTKPPAKDRGVMRQRLRGGMK